MILSHLLLLHGALAAGPTTTLKPQQPLSTTPPRKMAPQVTPELEAEIIEDFLHNRCDDVNQALSPRQYKLLRPLVRAVVAYCNPSQKIAEDTFASAEADAPDSDLVLVLHARYRWKKDPESAEPLWRRVLLVTRKKATKQMARDYLEGNIEEEQAIELGSIWSYFANLQTGGSYETNPTSLPQSDPGVELNPSGAENLQFSLGVQRGTGFGSASINYAIANNRYPAEHVGDYLDNSLETPIAFRVDTNADLLLRPFVDISTLGNSPFQAYGGIGVLGWVYRSDYNQSIQGSIFKDIYFPQELKAQQGSHFRLEYNWEFYPSDWFLRFLTYFEHVEANADVDLGLASLGASTITYSHNDVSLQFFIEHNLKWFIVGFNPRFLMRQDDNDSSYPTNPVGAPPGSGPTVTKRRQDFQIVLQPTLTVPLSAALQLFAWYEFNRTYSNLDATDYVDRNIQNQTVGLALRTFLGKIF